MGDLRGSRVWVTGASSGIGEAVALELAAHGARLGLSARREELLHALAARCRAAGATDVVVAVCDVTDDASVAAAHGAVVDGLGGVDVAFLNAGAWDPVDPRTLRASQFQQQFDVNVVGTARCIEHALPSMLARGAGHVVVVASLTAFVGLPRAEAYGASKAALRSMCDSLRADVAAAGVRVTTVYPGFVRTPMTDRNDFAMPGIMDADRAARIIVRGITRGRAEISFPWGLTSVLKLLATLPGPLRRAVLRRSAQRRPEPAAPAAVAGDTDDGGAT